MNSFGADHTLQNVEKVKGAAHKKTLCVNKALFAEDSLFTHHHMFVFQAFGW